MWQWVEGDTGTDGAGYGAVEKIDPFEQQKTHYQKVMGLLSLKEFLGLRRLLQTQRWRHRIGYRPDISIGITVPNVYIETLVLSSP